MKDDPAKNGRASFSYGVRLKYSETSLLEFTHRLASADPTPGGGSASAAVGALSAGLVHMVAQLTAGSPKFAHVADRAKRIADEAEKLMSRFVAAIDEDAQAFDRVSQAYRLPKSTQAERTARSAAIQAALYEAALPPLRVAEMAREAAALAVELAEFGNPNAISDVGCAALFAAAAARGASFNVSINANAVKDRAQAGDLLRHSHHTLAQVGVLVEVALGKVEASVEPDASA